MAIRRNEKEDNDIEKAQKQAEMIGEFAKDARNRKEAQKIATKLDSAIEQNLEKEQNLESAATKQQEYAVEEILDDTKDNIRRATREAAREIPQNTQRLGEIQEQTIQTTREIAYNYIEAQKEIISIYQSVWTPFIKNASIIFWNYWAISPKGMAETYGTVISSFTENVIAGTRLANSTISVNTKLLSTALQQTKDNSKELSRLSINAAKIFSETSNNLSAAGNSR
jgi:hypothetical protein